MILPKIKSKSEVWSAAGAAEFLDDLNVHGPRGGRRVVRGFWVNVSLSANVVGAALLKADLARTIGRIQVYQRGGKLRWNLTGLESRLAAQMYQGVEVVPTFADVAVASPAAIAYSLYIPLRKRYGRRGKDFAIPVEVLEKIRIEFPSSADLTIGASTVTILSGSYSITYDSHEDKPGEVLYYAEDEVTGINWGANTDQFQPKVRGPIHNMFLCRPSVAAGTGGGALSFTNFRCEALDLEPQTQTDHLAFYRQERPTAILDATDPVTLAKVFMPMFEVAETRVTDGKFVVSPMFTLTGNASTDIRAIFRVITGKDDGVAALVMAENKIGPNVQVKTASKSRRGTGEGWSDYELKLMPAKAAG